MQACVKEVVGFFFESGESNFFFGWSRENGLRN
jgi:hypothetical protein